MKNHEIFKVFSSEVRMEIFKMLVKDRLCVSKIVQNLDVTQPTVTQHLKILENCGLIKSKKIGSWVHYRANAGRIKKFKKELMKFIDLLDSVREDVCGSCHQNKCVKK